jgi:hypothetical protein
MGDAKDIILRPISAGEANALVKRVHYSGKVTQNSQIHIGVFYHGNLEGAMQFGPSLDKRKIQTLVRGTLWNEFIELNRMAFTDILPRNSESRALAIAFKLLRKHAPQLKWIVTFADATQCGDGTIYRAAGFVLTGIKENGSLWRFNPANVSFTPLRNVIAKNPILHEMYFRSVAWSETQSLCNGYYHTFASVRDFMAETGAEVLEGYQLRYIYFLDPAYRERLTVPVLPFEKIDEIGAGMYRGKKRSSSANEAIQDAPGDQSGMGGASPTRSL